MATFRQELEKGGWLRAVDTLEKEYREAEIVGTDTILMKHIMALEERVTELENGE